MVGAIQELLHPLSPGELIGDRDLHDHGERVRDGADAADQEQQGEHPPVLGQPLIAVADGGEGDQGEVERAPEVPPLGVGEPGHAPEGHDEDEQEGVDQALALGRAAVGTEVALGRPGGRAGSGIGGHVPRTRGLLLVGRELARETGDVAELRRAGRGRTRGLPHRWLRSAAGPGRRACPRGDGCASPSRAVRWRSTPRRAGPRRGTCPSSRAWPGADAARPGARAASARRLVSAASRRVEHAPRRSACPGASASRAAARATSRR